jgi:hypothetical protein
MTLEGQVMSLRFTGSLSTTRRVAMATALAASLAIPAIAAQDMNVTALLRNGERVTGRFDGFNQGQWHIDVSATDERKIPTGDIVVLDFVGGAQGLPETELSQARGDDHLLLTRGGAASRGRLVTVEGADRDVTVVFRTTSGEERRLRASEVGRLYLGRYPGGAEGTSTSTASPSGAPAQNGQVNVAANQRWVSTGINVVAGQQVTFNSSGEIQLSPDAADVATTAGSKLGRRASGAPLPADLAGALIGRVGNGRPFGIGNQPGPLPMPETGTLFLGVNDDNLDDNRGNFVVTVTAQPATPTTSRPGRIRRPSNR